MVFDNQNIHFSLLTTTSSSELNLVKMLKKKLMMSVIKTTQYYHEFPVFINKKDKELTNLYSFTYL